MPRQRRIGLTGGIASGKSSVGHWLASQGIPVLDADLYAQEALAPDTEASRAVLNRYGNKVSTQSNNKRIEAINRSALASIVFADKKERDWLENLLHPLVRKRFDIELLKAKHEPVVVLIIPLLFETGWQNMCTETWVVTCSLTQQRQRLMTRNSLELEEADQRINAQWQLDGKCLLADQVINNSEAETDWIPQVSALLKSPTHNV